MEIPGSTLVAKTTSVSASSPTDVITADAIAGTTPLASSQPTLNTLVKVLYGVGEISNSIKTYTFGLFLLFFYTSVMGLPGTLVGMATAITLIWDALIDPFIGHLSDGFKSRFGRRQPFMFVGAIVMGISFVLIFTPPNGLSASWLFAWLVGTNILLRSMNSVFIVPYHALGAELSQNYFERTSITGMRAGFALLGTLVAAGLSFAYFFPPVADGIDPKFNVAGYTKMGIVFGLAITITGLIATFGTLGPARRLANAAAPSLAAPEALPFFQGLRLSFRNRTFLLLTLSSAIFFLASVINATLGVHYLTYYAQISDSRMLSLFQASFYVGALLGVPFWMRNARYIPKHQIFVVATLLLALIISSAYLLVGEGRLLGVGNATPLIIANAIGGFVASAIWVLPASMLADIVDEDELVSGMRREGTYFGIHSFFQQEAASIAVLLAGFLLDSFALLVPGQIEQSALTRERLGILYSLLPALLFIIAALFMLRYKLTPKRVAAIQAQLAQKRHGSDEFMG